MGVITPEDTRKKKLLYRRHQKHFEQKSFTWQIACELIPIIQQSVWDMFGLFCYAKKIPEGGTYLELGSKWGGSLACVFYASQAAGHKIQMIAIEPQLLPKCKSFCKKHGVLLIKGYSHGVAHTIKDDSIDFLFIDGPHNYKTVSRDLRYYWPKVKVGGFVTGHDHVEKFPGVVKAVREFFGGDYEVLPHSAIYVVRKKEVRAEEA